jgi:hypothetical protein
MPQPIRHQNVRGHDDHAPFGGGRRGGEAGVGVGGGRRGQAAQQAAHPRSCPRCTRCIYSR